MSTSHRRVDGGTGPDLRRCYPQSRLPKGDLVTVVRCQGTGRLGWGDLRTSLDLCRMCDGPSRIRPSHTGVGADARSIIAPGEVALVLLRGMEFQDGMEAVKLTSKVDDLGSLR